jgi:hypothetical protein
MRLVFNAFAAVQESGCGPRLTTWALQQVVSFLGYSGRAADVASTTAHDPSRDLPHAKLQQLGYSSFALAVYSIYLVSNRKHLPLDLDTRTR